MISSKPVVLYRWAIATVSPLSQMEPQFDVSIADVNEGHGNDKRKQFLSFDLD